MFMVLYCKLVFIRYGCAFFLDCCLWCFVVCLAVRCFILGLFNTARNGLNDKIFSNTYLERRQRTRFPTFATEAQQWMARYESLAGFFGYSPVEMMEEL
ncbi:hypothetical protein BC941DRAFT_439724 [Chlamydoabsidia padenii]|nr:hypothetical protein BC941DRAFT_439724 [Chlamydoabsidia padenii]